MIRSIILLLSITSFSRTMYAKDGFYCIPSMKSTWISVEKKSDVFAVLVKNPKGYDQMPQFDGPTSPITIPFQKMQFDDLKALGDEFVLEWPVDQCEYNHKEMTLFCRGQASKKTAGIESYGFNTIQITEKYKDDTYQKNRYRINFEKDGNTYFTSIEFYTNTCENFK